MADMKYEEVYASIPVCSWDRAWVSDKTNIIYCTHKEKVPRIRTDASPFTHGDVLPLNAFSVFSGAGGESAAHSSMKGV